ncbi:hypothetical protein IHE45_03G039000 [Dioscorea alata]|uniref:Uncharacterized protein n=1 Tax=Dioscorea alata TaxID=55571 RepID=A0ACB7WKE0_DIOAL|nr:hypothetical protein IHE45_03G039000 [Dioscorea alata]
MDDIDPHILEEHFVLVDALSGPSQPQHTQNQVYTLFHRLFLQHKLQLSLGRGHRNYLHGKAKVLLLPQLNMAWRQGLVQILPRLKGKIKALEGKRHRYLQEHLLDIKTSVLRLLFFALLVHKLYP